MNVNLDSFVAVPIPTELYDEFARRYPRGISSVLVHIARDFLERTAEDHSRKQESKGVYWESLFLPDGTQIRTKYFGEFKVAQVTDGKIHWDRKLVPSMSQLARAMRGDTSNNAWKVLELKRPTDAQWQAADFLRRLGTATSP